MAKDALATGDQVAINFLRTGLKQDGGGHWSPIAAYNEVNDMFLLIDVSRSVLCPLSSHARTLHARMYATLASPMRSRERALSLS
jgi:hypothetical protein